MAVQSNIITEEGITTHEKAKTRLNNVVGRLKSGAGHLGKMTKEAFIVPVAGFKSFFKVTKNPKQENEILHSTIYQLEKSHYHVLKSELKDQSFKSSKGEEIVKYNHYNKINNSIDLNFEKRIPVKIPGCGTLQCDNVTLLLNKDNKIDLSMNENRFIFNDNKVVCEAVKQYPESFESIPIKYFEDNQNKKSFLEAFNAGVNARIENGEMGVDENGERRKETEYINDMKKIGEGKRQEYNNYKTAQTNFSKEIGEEW